MFMHYNKLTIAKEYTSFAGHFNGNSDQAVQCQVHCLMKQVCSYTRCHWTLLLGKDLPRIAPADAMVIDFGSKIDLWHCETAFWKLAFKRHATDPLLSTSKQQAV